MGSISFVYSKYIHTKNPNQKMKLAFASLAGLAASRSLTSDFQSFKNKYAKLYSPLEETRRFNIWKENLAFVERHNRDYEAGLETYTVAMNEFADLTNAEFHTRYLAMTQESAQIRLNYQCPVNWSDDGDANPDAVDWRTTANPQSTVAVTSVKDQGSCGSCWSFGGAAAFESAMCLDGQQDCTSWTGASEQQLVDCGNKDNAALGPYYDMACNGGWIDNALYYVMQTGYLDNYDDYPYVSGTTRQAGTCVADPSTSAGNLSTCGATAKNSESELQGALSQVGAVGIAIDAGGVGFQLYSGGVYTSSTCSSSRLNHAVTAVGYGADADGTPYWTVKNSWGTAWGDQGYILMRRNYNNMCGVAATPAYAIA